MRLSKSRISILAIVLLFCVVNIFWSEGSLVYAQAGLDSLFDANGSISVDWIKSADAILKTLYLFMRPLLAIAGAALDNSLVYGKPFFLDVTLFRFWELMRTFTMFAVGFIFIGTILYAFVNPNEAQTKIKDVVVKSLIATIAINMSWFLVAAMVDLSTIGVVAIGALPLNIMGGAETIKDIRFLTTHSYYDNVKTAEADRNESPYDTIYSCGEGDSKKFFISCHLDYTPEDGDTPAKSGMVPVGDENTINTQKKDIADTKRRWGVGGTGTPGSKIKLNVINEQFCAEQGVLIEYKEGRKPSECEDRLVGKNAGITAMSGTFACTTFSEISSQAANSSGPLFTLYGSIFAVSNLPATTSFGNSGEVAIEMIMKIFVGAGLIIPLLAFAVVMVIRVVVLWLVIAFSPILALAYVYDFKKITELGDGKFSFQNILSLLFMPVIGVFALSISIVFLSVLNNVDYIQDKVGDTPQHRDNQCHDDPFTGFTNGAVKDVGPPDSLSEVENTKCYEFLGIQTLCISESLRTFGGNSTNTMVWLIMNGLGIALMRMSVMFVLKTNKFTEGTVDFIDKTAQSIMKSAKIIPVPGVPGGVSMGGATRALQQMKTNIPRDIINKQYTDGGMADLTERWNGDEGGVKADAIAAAKAGAENGNATRINTTKAGKGETLDSYGSGFINDMGTSVAKAIKADQDAKGAKSKYARFTDSDLSSLSGVTSSKDLMANEAFIAHAVENDYLKTFTKDRYGNVSQSSRTAQGVQQLVDGLTKVSTDANTKFIENDGQGNSVYYFFHDGKATTVKRKIRTGLLAEEITSIDFTLPDGVALPVGGKPNSFEDAEDFLSFMGSKDIAYDTDKLETIFGADYPYKEFIEEIRTNIKPDTASQTLSKGIMLGGTEHDFTVVLSDGPAKKFASIKYLGEYGKKSTSTTKTSS